MSEQPTNHASSVSVGAVLTNSGSEQLNQDVGTNVDGVGISEYRRRRNRELKNKALEPMNSFNRFRESLNDSSMPEPLKERFRNLK